MSTETIIVKLSDPVDPKLANKEGFITRETN